MEGFPERLIRLQPFWGAWKLDTALGEGSYGKVYRIKREEFGETYYAALKWIAFPQSQSEVYAYQCEGRTEGAIREHYAEAVRELRGEITMMSQLRGNTHIVSFEDHAFIERTDEIGWDVLIRMELLTSLPHLKLDRLSVGDVVRLGCDLCDALSVCNKRQIVHRDIKPDNIFINDFGDYKLGDFGVARQMEKTQGDMSRKGTPFYMAPEVYSGRPADASVDQYSLGLVMHRLLNGQQIPFAPNTEKILTHAERESAFEARIRGVAVPPPMQGSEALKRAICKACAFDPSKRFASPDAFKKALMACADDKQNAQPLLSGISPQMQSNRSSIVGPKGGAGTAKKSDPRAPIAGALENPGAEKAHIVADKSIKDKDHIAQDISVDSHKNPARNRKTPPAKPAGASGYARIAGVLATGIVVLLGLGAWMLLNDSSVQAPHATAQNTPMPPITTQSLEQATHAPTVEPTPLPTAAPTAVPTIVPTTVPTIAPTIAPTAPPALIPAFGAELSTPEGFVIEDDSFAIYTVGKVEGSTQTIYYSDITSHLTKGYFDVKDAYPSDVLTTVIRYQSQYENGAIVPVEHRIQNPIGAIHVYNDELHVYYYEHGDGTQGTYYGYVAPSWFLSEAGGTVLAGNYVYEVVFEGHIVARYEFEVLDDERVFMERTGKWVLQYYADIESNEIAGRLDSGKAYELASLSPVVNSQGVAYYQLYTDDGIVYVKGDGGKLGFITDERLIALTQGAVAPTSQPELTPAFGAELSTPERFWVTEDTGLKSYVKTWSFLSHPSLEITHLTTGHFDLPSVDHRGGLAIAANLQYVVMHLTNEQFQITHRIQNPSGVIQEFESDMWDDGWIFYALQREWFYADSNTEEILPGTYILETVLHGHILSRYTFELVDSSNVFVEKLVDAETRTSVWDGFEYIEDVEYYADIESGKVIGTLDDSVAYLLASMTVVFNSENIAYYQIYVDGDVYYVKGDGIDFITDERLIALTQGAVAPTGQPELIPAFGAELSTPEGFWVTEDSGLKCFVRSWGNFASRASLETTHLTTGHFDFPSHFSHWDGLAIAVNLRYVIMHKPDEAFQITHRVQNPSGVIQEFESNIWGDGSIFYTLQREWFLCRQQHRRNSSGNVRARNRSTGTHPFAIYV